VNREFFSSLEKWMALAGNKAVAPTLIYAGDESYRHKEVNVLSWRHCGAEKKEN
jgi:uncharacterized protein